MVIRPFSAGDKPALYDLLAEVWPNVPPETLDRRWWWQQDRVPLLLADDGGRVVGMCGYIPFVMRDRGAEREGAWVVDFFVRPSSQGKGIGKKMVADIAARFDFLASLDQTDAAWMAFQRAGWRERGFAPLYMSPSARVSASLAGMQRGEMRPVGDLQLIPVRFGPETEALWVEVRDRMAPAALRDVATLDSRFGHSDRGYVVIEARVNGVLRGYAVVRVMPAGSIRSFRRHRIAIVSDYLVHPDTPGVFASLVRRAAQWAASQGVRFVLCMATEPRHRRVLRRSGFLGPDTPVVGRKLGKLAVGFTATPNAPLPEPWHITPMDCDLDLLFHVQP